MTEKEALDVFTEILDSKNDRKTFNATEFYGACYIAAKLLERNLYLCKDCEDFEPDAYPNIEHAGFCELHRCITWQNELCDDIKRKNDTKTFCHTQKV